LTRAKFRADGAGGDLRTYRTGDLGYRLADGCLVHVGRKDFQAKIRGHRVEMSAVETALHEIPSVKQAVAVSESHGVKGDRLVAYVVAKDKRAARSKSWRARLKTLLPEYMIPAQFVVLDRLPLNAGGKVDRRALPGGKNAPGARSARVAAPRSELEKLLWGLWREALQLDSLGMDEDFVELGGDSLQAAQVVARVGELFPLRKPLVALAEAPTVAALERFILAQETRAGQSETSPIDVRRRCQKGLESKPRDTKRWLKPGASSSPSCSKPRESSFRPMVSLCCARRLRRRRCQFPKSAYGFSTSSTRSSRFTISPARCA
jgi:acyl carrier protein